MMVTTTATGSAITNGSTVGQGAVVIMVDCPTNAWEIPKASADFLNPKSSHSRLTTDPETTPAIAPSFVALLQYKAAVYMDRNAAAVIPNHRDVPTATILAGRMYPITSAIKTATSIPILATLTEDPPVFRRIVS